MRGIHDEFEERREFACEVAGLHMCDRVAVRRERDDRQREAAESLARERVRRAPWAVKPGFSTTTRGAVLGYRTASTKGTFGTNTRACMRPLSPERERASQPPRSGSAKRRAKTPPPPPPADPEHPSMWSTTPRGMSAAQHPDRPDHTSLDTVYDLNKIGVPMMRSSAPRPCICWKDFVDMTSSNVTLQHTGMTIGFVEMPPISAGV